MSNTAGGKIAAQTPARNTLTMTRNSEGRAANSTLVEKALAERDDYILDQQHNIKYLQNQSKPPPYNSLLPVSHLDK